jgi:hypothetical protein
LCVNVLFEESSLHTFDGTHGAYRHKNRGRYIPMVGMYHTCACARVRICMYEVKKSLFHSVEMR